MVKSPPREVVDTAIEGKGEIEVAHLRAAYGPVAERLLLCPSPAGSVFCEKLSGLAQLEFLRACGATPP